MSRFWIALLIGLSCAPVFAAGYLSYRDGAEEYDRGNYAAAFATFQRLAEGGDARSQNALGQMYFLGESTRQDHATAAMWFRRAGNQGIASAQLSLANMYVRGQGVPESLIDAYMWYSLSGAFASGENEKLLALVYRDQITRRMKAVDRKEAQHRACAWWRNHRLLPPRPAVADCAAW